VEADESQWDPVQKRALSKFSTAADTWIEDNADLDPDRQEGRGIAFGNLDAERVALLNKLNYKETQTADDMHSGPSNITGDGNSTGASSLRSETSEGAAMGRTTDLKLKLARATTAVAERDATLAKLQAQIS
jgi:hypothetical protein